MTWEDLLGDLELRWAVEEAAQLAGEVDERRAAELGALTLADRLRPLVGSEAEIMLGLNDFDVLGGHLRHVGAGWLLVARGAEEVVVSLAQVRWISGLTRQVEPRGARPSDAALGLRHALGAVVRDRAAVAVLVTGGDVLHGTLDAVGSDHVLLALHPAGEARRADAVLGVRAVALSAVVAVRRLA